MLTMSQASGASLGEAKSAPGWLGRSMPHPRARHPSAARRAPRPPPISPAPHPTETAASTLPLHTAVQDWLLRVLPHAALHRPAVKRLALLVTGLLAGDGATASGLAAALHPLAITPARELSIQRRIARAEADPQLDPLRVLPALFAPLLPTLLRAALAAHAANEPSGPAHHRRFVALRLVVDATTKGDAAHVLTVGLAYQGLVLPLLVGCWEQNAPLPPGQYMAEVLALLGALNRLLPAELRDHVLLLADRLFGTPAMLDLLGGLGWHWVLRVQGQTRVRGADGGERAVRELAPTPGSLWAAEATAPPDPAAPVAAFKAAGWRPCRVVAAWLVGQDEPWLLLTDLAASLARLRDYAARWAIERLFLSWKSHGFDLEAAGLADPARLGRLLTGLIIATLWRLAAAGAVAGGHLADLARRRPQPRQLPLLDAGAPPPPPWPAKFSLLTWGARQFREVSPRWGTPALCWAFPDWDAPPWSQRCCEAYYGAA
jgi:hypothetical protein